MSVSEGALKAHLDRATFYTPERETVSDRPKPPPPRSVPPRSVPNVPSSSASASSTGQGPRVHISSNRGSVPSPRAGSAPSSAQPPPSVPSTHLINQQQKQPKYYVHRDVAAANWSPSSVSNATSRSRHCDDINESEYPPVRRYDAKSDFMPHSTRSRDFSREAMHNPPATAARAAKTRTVDCFEAFEDAPQPLHYSASPRTHVATSDRQRRRAPAAIPGDSDFYERRRDVRPSVEVYERVPRERSRVIMREAEHYDDDDVYADENEDEEVNHYSHQQHVSSHRHRGNDRAPSHDDDYYGGEQPNIYPPRNTYPRHQHDDDYVPATSTNRSARRAVNEPPPRALRGRTVMDAGGVPIVPERPDLPQGGRVVSMHSGGLPQRAPSAPVPVPVPAIQNSQRSSLHQHYDEEEDDATTRRTSPPRMGRILNAGFVEHADSRPGSPARAASPSRRRRAAVPLNDDDDDDCGGVGLRIFIPHAELSPARYVITSPKSRAGEEHSFISSGY
eukprot:PhM_4_TR17219/c0_g1_i1/m.88814